MARNVREMNMVSSWLLKAIRTGIARSATIIPDRIARMGAGRNWCTRPGPTAVSGTAELP
jgi:hypothetical protein